MNRPTRTTSPSLLFLSLLLTSCVSPPPAPTLGFTHLPDRPWPGPSWYANRIQDWRLRNGRLECIEGGQRFGFRTAHLLTGRVPAGAQAVDLRIDVTAIDAGPLLADSAAGFLVGCGDDATDHRLTAMIQKAPAPGGGILAVVDGTGRARLLDFSLSEGNTGSWGIASKATLSDLPVLAQGSDPTAAFSGPLTLRLRWEGTTLTLDVLSNSTAISRAVLEDRPVRASSSGIGLLSHWGTADSERGFAFSAPTFRGLTSHPERAFGPVLAVQYTLDRDGDGTHTLKLTAQMPVLGPDDPGTARLEIRRHGRWQRIASTSLRDGSFTFPFRVEGLRIPRDTPYRVVYAADEYRGILRAEPSRSRPLVLASLSCVKNYTGGLKWNHDGLWFPHADLVERVDRHDPDMLFFAGDQIYEGDISPPDRRSERKNLLDYHTKWQRFLWAFGELTRRAPTVTIPDDHDVYHGNLWGAGGIRAVARDGLRDQDAGGYKLPAALVNHIHATQTSHLPDALIPGPVGQGIDPYTTRLVWGGLDCAILSDRMFKDSASIKVPEGKVVNGFFKVDGFDPKDADVPGAQLLGLHQEAFLARWAEDRPDDTWIKLVLSQSPFTTVHSLPHPARTDAVVPSLEVPAPGEYPENDVPVLDADSNGWPQTARNRALRFLRLANALHLAGDQHLGTVVRYGIDAWRDGTIAFTSPAVGNTWPRRWMPRERGGRQAPGAPRYTGDYLDGFGNRITMLAAANPSATGREPRALFDRSPGYGIVRLDPERRRYTLEAWPRWADPRQQDQMFPGWPLSFEVGKAGDSSHRP